MGGGKLNDAMRRYLIGGIVGVVITASVLWGAGILRVGQVDVAEEVGAGSGTSGGAGSGAGGGAGSGTSGETTAEEAPLFDGPYVFWSGETLAYVGSICGDSAIFETHEAVAGATLRFADPCAPEHWYEVDTAPPEIEPAEFEEAARIFAVSDVEGNLDELLLLLQAGGVIDQDGRWAYGDGRLVFVGDMVDRGEQVTEVLWFVHQLEPQALQAGGRVHVVLGNHDAMLLYNDVRYADEKYKLVAPKFRASLSGLYGPSTELGRWLRTKPALLRIGEVLFVHGGVSNALVEAGLDLGAVNEAIRLGLDEPWRTRAPGTMQMLFASDGPLWYRGYFRGEELTTDQISGTLAAFGARKVVVGHTIVDTVQNLHEGVVYGVDVTFTEADQVEGLLIEDGRFSRVDVHGQTSPL
jgi:hypothetical protein